MVNEFTQTQQTRQFCSGVKTSIVWGKSKGESDPCASCTFCKEENVGKACRTAKALLLAVYFSHDKLECLENGE
jgi:hypothetical protein